MNLVFPKRLRLARLPTPIQPLRRIAQNLDCNIWVKRDDLTGLASSGNKVRKLEFILARARAAGAQVLITCGGVQSNHCRATAILGARLGFKVHLLLRGAEPKRAEGNLLLSRVAGATIRYFAPDHYRDQLDSIFTETAADYRERGLKPWLIPTGGSDGVGVWGYLAAAKEIAAQQEEQGVTFDHLITATGSGGTQAGLTLGAHLYLPRAQVTGIAVCDDAAYFQRKVYEDLRAWGQLYGQRCDIDALDVGVLDRYIGAGYGKAGRTVFECIEQLARTEGLVLDPVYTGKAFRGMLAEIAAGRLGGNILFIHTGGIYGMLAQAEEYDQHATPSG